MTEAEEDYEYHKRYYLLLRQYQSDARFSMNRSEETSLDKSGNSVILQSVSANLDNGIPQAQASDTPCTEGDTDMAKRIQQRVTIGINSDGSPQQKVVYGYSKQEVLMNAARLLVESGALKGTSNLHSSPKFKAYLEEWWKLYKLPKLKPTTLQTYRNMIDKHILPEFGNEPMADITTNDVQRFFNGREHLTKSSVRQMRILLHQVFTAAVEDKLINRDPTDSKRITLSQRRTRREPLSLDDFYAVLNKLDLLAPKDRCIVALLAYTGMRRGEMLGLRWEDVDFEGGFLFVKQSVTYNGNQPNISTPKSTAGYRKIPIPDELKKILASMPKNGYVIGGESKPITESTFDRAWQRIDKSIDLHGATPHVFRHTYLTALKDSGADVKTIQAIGGHADIRTTMNLYVHNRDENILEAGKLLNNTFASKVHQSQQPSSTIDISV